MIHVNISDINTKFKEVYVDPQEVYLFPSYYLGYLAGLMPETPNLAIPGQDAHMIVAAHNGRMAAEILKMNTLSCERAVTSTGKKPKNTQSNGMYNVSTSNTSTSWYN